MRGDQPELNANNVVMAAPDIIRYRCPVCGWETSIGAFQISFQGFPEYDGNYCLPCLGKWISENVPRMERI